MKKPDEARAEIVGYQAGEVSAETLLKRYEGIIVNATRAFANPMLAGIATPGAGLPGSPWDPKALGRVHKTMSREDQGRFRRNIDFAKYGDLKSDFITKLLEELKAYPPDKIKDPFGFVKAMLWNHGRDLANREKREYKRFPPKPVVILKRGEAPDIVERGHDRRAWNPDAKPEKAPPRMKSVAKMPPHELARAYLRVFPSEEFRAAVEKSICLVEQYFQIAKPRVYWPDFMAQRESSLSLRRHNAEYLEWYRKFIKKRPFLDDETLFKLDREAKLRIAELNELMQSHTDRFYSPCRSEANYIRRLCPAFLSIAGDEDRGAAQHIWKLNVSPLRMLYDIWARTDEVKRKYRPRGTLRWEGTLKQNSRAKMRFLFEYNKQVATGSARETLFKKIQDAGDIENLRKYRYRRVGRGNRSAAYRWLVNSIYKRSFIEQPAA